MDISLIDRANYTERCHTLPVLGSYNLAQHQWGVAQLCRILWPDHCDKSVLELALDHDMPEVEFGDMPAPTKLGMSAECIDQLQLAEWSWCVKEGVTPELGARPRHFYMVKVADYLELMMFCLRQRKMGNTMLNQVFTKACDLVEDYCGKLIDCWDDAPMNAVSDVRVRLLEEHANA